MKTLVIAVTLALLAACTSLVSQGSSAPQDNFEYPYNSRYGI